MINKTGTALFFIGLMLLTACALKVPPTGGDKDITPPAIKKMFPENFSTSFAGKQIVIAFNEFIQLKDLDKQLIISPIIKPAPLITVRGKSVVIELKKELLPNTTYTFNFGNAIVDLHEGNAAEDFKYVLSTGSYVDTLHIDGKVVNASDLKTEKGILVMLYADDAANDSLPYLRAPDFFSRTDEAGNFSVQNINQGPFKLFALKDADADYKFNSVDEAIGFMPAPVYASDSAKHTLMLFKETAEKLFVKKSYYENNARVNIVFNKSCDASFESLDGKKKWRYAEVNALRDSVILWLADTVTDSLHLVVREKDNVIDTLLIRNTPVNLKAAKPVRSHAFAIASNSLSGIHPAMPLMLSASLPVLAFDTAKITLSPDSTTRLEYKMGFADTLMRRVIVSAAWKEKKIYTLTLLPGAVQSIYGHVNDTITLSFLVNAITDYGSVKVTLTLPDSVPYLLQLVNDNDAPVYERMAGQSGVYVFENCMPSKYKLRAIRDADGNGKFTTGKYMAKQQPEYVYYYKEAINIRANWDIETDWVLKKE